MVADHRPGAGLDTGIDDRVGTHDNAEANLGVGSGARVDMADCVTFLGLAHDRVLLDLGVLADAGATADHRVRADPCTGTDLDAAYRSFSVGGYEDRGRVDGYSFAEQEQTRPRQLSRAHRLTWSECLFAHLHPLSRLSPDTASTALMRRQGKTSWQVAATACTPCKRACTQREMRLWSRGSLSGESDEAE